MHYFATDSQFLNIISIVAAIIAGSMTLITLLTILYHRYIYPKRIYPTFNSSYQPRCSIILPCKGVSPFFEKNIRSFLDLEYQHYEVLFCVESQNDPAVPVIQNVIKNETRARIVIAGITTKCSQKNYNMIAAIESANNPEVYVFADSDIKLYKNWLTELIKPLSRNDITVSTGFRWLYSTNGTIGEIANAYQNTILFVLFSVTSFLKNIGLWGGSMAIRKQDFEQLGVQNYWAQTVVDDMSLSRLIMKSSKKSIMVSSCITPTDEALTSLLQSIRWFKRQVMFLKAYQRPHWFSAVTLGFCCLFLVGLLPISVLITTLTDRSFANSGGYASLIFILGTMTSCLLFPFIGKHPQIIKFFCLQPISLLTVLGGVLGTVFSKTVLWSGFKYTLNTQGKVTSVEQINKK